MHTMFLSNFLLKKILKYEQKKNMLGVYKGIFKYFSQICLSMSSTLTVVHASETLNFRP